MNRNNRLHHLKTNRCSKEVFSRFGIILFEPCY